MWQVNKWVCTCMREAGVCVGTHSTRMLLVAVVCSQPHTAGKLATRRFAPRVARSQPHCRKACRADTQLGTKTTWLSPDRRPILYRY